MTAKKDNENKDNLLQMIFDHIWYSIFPKPRIGTISQEELEEVFPCLPDNIKYKLPSKEDKKEFRIPLGQTFRKKIVYWNPNSIPHILCCGATGSGKSVATKSILTSIINMFNEEQIEITLIDFKIIELFAFRNCKQVINYAYEVEDALELISEALNECRNRYRLFQEYEVTNLKDYNKKSKDKLKYQFIFIEEFIVLSQHKNGIKMLNELISLSRAAGIFLYISCQRPDHTVISPLLKANTGNKICFRTEDSKNSVIVLDREGAENLRGNGNGLLKQGSTFTEFQGYFISDQEVKKLIGPYIKPKNENKPTNEQTINDDNKTSKNGYERARAISNDNNIIDLSFIDNL